MVGLAALRGPMQLLLGGATMGMGTTLAAGLLWACAVPLCIGKLEPDVELVPKDNGTAAARVSSRATGNS